VRLAVDAASTSVMTLAGVVALLAAAGGLKMWLHNCFESHLMVVLAVVAATIGTVLSLLVGVPGGAPTKLSGTHVLTFFLSAATGVLLVIDAGGQSSPH
jgi:small basic protein